MIYEESVTKYVRLIIIMMIYVASVAENPEYVTHNIPTSGLQRRQPARFD